MAKVARGVVVVSLISGLAVVLSLRNSIPEHKAAHTAAVKGEASKSVVSSHKSAGVNMAAPIATSGEGFHTYSDPRHFAAFDHGRFEYAPSQAYRNLVFKAKGSTERVPMLKFELERAAVGRQALYTRSSKDVLVRSEDRRFSMSKGLVTERYDVREDGIEQSFMVSELPERGTLSLSGRLESNLPVLRANESEVVFGKDGGDSLFYRDAIAVDARGASVRIPMTYADGMVTLDVPSEFVTSAALPITVDPLVGSPILVDGGMQNFFQWRPVDVACDQNAGYLVMWSEATLNAQNQVTDGNVYAQLLDSNGNLIGGEITLAGTVDIESLAAVAYGNGVYLTVWDHLDPATSVWKLECRTVTPGGALGAVSLVHSTPGLNQISPYVSWDGAKFLVAWEQQSGANTFDAVIKTVSTAGVPGTYLAVDTTPNNKKMVQVNPIPGTTNALVVWMQAVNGTWDVYGRRIDTAAPSLNGASVEIVNDATNHDYWPNPTGNSTNNEWLICWESVNPNGPNGTTPGDVMARRMLSDGTLQPIFSVKATSSDNTYPYARWSPANNEYLVSYHDNTSGTYNIMAAKVAGGANTVLTSTIQISNGAQNELWQSVALNTATNRAMFAWLKQFNGWQIWAQRFDVTAGAGGGGAATDTPVAPAALVATVGGDTQINLTWTHTFSNETGFNIERSSDGFIFVQVGSVGTNTTAYADTGLASGTKYYYRVVAKNANGASAPSNVASATTTGQSNGGNGGNNSGNSGGGGGSSGGGGGGGGGSFGCGLIGLEPLALLALLLYRRRRRS